MICSIEDCEKSILARGWCQTHYHRWHRWGDPNALHDPKRGKCSLADCDRDHYGKGYCAKHWKRWYTKGHTKGRATVKERLLRSIKKTEDDCWEWQLSLRKGYGRIKVNGRNLVASRVSYETFIGEIPDGFEIDHLCRNPVCINPEHLEPVTGSENSVRRDTANSRQRNEQGQFA